MARGERWAFRRYDSRTELFVDGRRLMHDAFVLDPGDGPLDAAHRAGRYDCIATNALLSFDRAASCGKRLDIPASTAVRIEPGETKTVTLVDIAGGRIIRGGNDLADGPSRRRI